MNWLLQKDSPWLGCMVARAFRAPLESAFTCSLVIRQLKEAIMHPDRTVAL